MYDPTLRICVLVEACNATIPLWGSEIIKAEKGYVLVTSNGDKYCIPFERVVYVQLLPEIVEVYA